MGSDQSKSQGQTLITNNSSWPVKVYIGFDKTFIYPNQSRTINTERKQFYTSSKKPTNYKYPGTYFCKWIIYTVVYNLDHWSVIIEDNPSKNPKDRT